MARYNFIKDGQSYSLDMTNATVAEYFKGGELSYEAADFYGYYGLIPFPKGHIDTGYNIFISENLTGYIWAIPNRGINLILSGVNIYLYSDAERTSLIESFFSSGQCAGGSLYPEGTNKKGMSARRLIYFTATAKTNYEFDDQTTTKQGRFSLLTGQWWIDNTMQGSVLDIYEEPGKVEWANCDWWLDFTFSARDKHRPVTFRSSNFSWIGTTTNLHASGVHGSGYAYLVGETVYLTGSPNSGYTYPKDWGYDGPTGAHIKSLTVSRDGSNDFGLQTAVPTHSYGYVCQDGAGIYVYYSDYINHHVYGSGSFTVGEGTKLTASHKSGSVYYNMTMYDGLQEFFGDQYTFSEYVYTSQTVKCYLTAGVNMLGTNASPIDLGPYAYDYFYFPGGSFVSGAAPSGVSIQCIQRDGDRGDMVEIRNETSSRKRLIYVNITIRPTNSQPMAYLVIS